MTDHLTEFRCCELGLDPGSGPTALEEAHLQECAACRHRLAEEQALTASLETLAQAPAPELPADFLTRTTRRFRRARQARQWRHVAVAAFVALGAGLLLSVPVLLALVSGFSATIRALALAAAALATWIDAAAAVFGGLPLLSVLSVSLVSAILLSCAASLARLGQRVAAVK